jgi:hypothetical protein
MKIALIFGLFLMGIGQACAWHGQCPTIEISVDGAQIPRYYHQGTTYVEATKGKEYSILVCNPLGERIAVALSVDGLNTINAQHTEARLASKWILGPYESVVINGWQVNDRQARRFFFTTEAKSYGAWLGRTENLGLISAAFFRERPRPVIREEDEPRQSQALPQGAPAMEKSKGTELKSQQGNDQAAGRAPQPEYAATGIGHRVRHEVQRVYMDLEDRPFATVNLRYEFRPILLELGVVPVSVNQDSLARRQRAQGFREGTYCPEP